MHIKSTIQNSTLSEMQDAFIKKLIKERTLIHIYLINGIKLEGYIIGFDSYVIFLEGFASGVTQMIYKHAISTLVLRSNGESLENKTLYK